jgi:Na+/melibiose symporter-like transporter
MIGNVAGLVIAGIIVNIRSIGAIGGFYIDSATFFISASLIAMMAQREFITGVRNDLVTSSEAFRSSLKRSFLAEIKEGFGIFAKYSAMRFIAYVFFLLMAALGAISCVIIVFVQSAFGTSTRDLGFLGMFLVAGLFLGTVFYGRFGQKVAKRTVIFASFIASGIFITAFTFFVGRYPNLPAAGILAALLGASAGPIMSATNTLTHETIPEEMRGRIFSSLEAVIHLAFLVFMFGAAYAAKYIDRFWILVVCGMALSVCGIVGMVLETRPKATCS